MATTSRPIPLPLPLPLPLPTASPRAVTPFAMNSLSRLRLATGYSRFATSCPSSSNRLSKVTVPSAARVRVSSSTDSVVNANWLASLTCPLPRKDEPDLDSESDSGKTVVGSGSGPEWIIGVDPDASGALALLRPDQSACGYSAEVFDAPFVKVLVGKTFRKRLDPRSMGWWSGGFGYGMWLGVLVASGISVKPISSASWKNFFELSRGSSTKDDSRRVASDMFPSLSCDLKRKKDHGRAEALLIAAYGRSLTQQSNLKFSLTEAKELQLQSC